MTSPSDQAASDQAAEAAPQRDWDPAAYGLFSDLRLRPVLDLAARIGPLPPGDIVDLGCGAGAAAGVLRRHWPGRRLTGLDASPAMLAQARAAAGYDDVALADAAQWQPQVAPALIFSNAVMHWLPDHARLLPRLAMLPAPGGVLAVQMPRQFDAPSHALIRSVAAALFPEMFDWTDWQPPVAPPATLLPLLAPLGRIDIWETEYLQLFPPAGGGDGAHPVRRFTQSTALRPVLERLDAQAQARFLAAYDAALEEAYPRTAEGGAVMPFRRQFFVLRRQEGEGEWQA